MCDTIFGYHLIRFAVRMQYQINCYWPHLLLLQDLLSRLLLLIFSLWQKSPRVTRFTPSAHNCPEGPWAILARSTCWTNLQSIYAHIFCDPLSLRQICLRTRDHKKAQWQLMTANLEKAKRLWRLLDNTVVTCRNTHTALPNGCTNRENIEILIRNVHPQKCHRFPRN